MALVIHNGTQYDTERLPAGINPADCVPVDEWYAANRTTSPRKAAPKPFVTGEHGPEVFVPTKGARRK